MADKVYVVNHTLLGTGQQAGEPFQPSGGKVLNRNTGEMVDVDIDRLVGLFAIREATAEEQAAFNTTGLLPPDAMLLGDAPEGQTRVSSDTFAAVDPRSVPSAGGNQSDVAAARAKSSSAKNTPADVPGGTPQAEQPAA